MLTWLNDELKTWNDCSMKNKMQNSLQNQHSSPECWIATELIMDYSAQASHQCILYKMINLTEQFSEYWTRDVNRKTNKNNRKNPKINRRRWCWLLVNVWRQMIIIVVYVQYTAHTHQRSTGTNQRYSTFKYLHIVKDHNNTHSNWLWYCIRYKMSVCARISFFFYFLV